MENANIVLLNGCLEPKPELYVAFFFYDLRRKAMVRHHQGIVNLVP